MLPPELLTQDSSDRFFDYCHYGYDPETETRGKLHSLALFDRVLELSGAPPAWSQLIHDLRARVGLDATVWGVKWVGGQLYVELYFYNYGRVDPRVTPSTVLDVMAPYFGARLPSLDAYRYFMFSIDVWNEHFATRKLDGVHMYVHDVQERPTAFSHLVSESGIALENHYAFYRPAIELEALKVKVVDSMVVDFQRAHFGEILLPEYIRAKSVCIANKPRVDAIYYSGLGVDALLSFLRRFDYPAPLVRYVEENRARLDHLQYDFGWDYRSGARGLEAVKSGFYGTF